MSEAQVIQLNAHERMSPEEVLAFASREDWGSVVICGYHKGDKELVVRSSAMTREQALWIIEHTKLHTLGMK